MLTNDRRRWATLSLVLATALIVVACGGATTTPQETQQATPQASGQPAASQAVGSAQPQYVYNPAITVYSGVDANLIAPPGAKSYDAQFGTPLKAPTSGGMMSLPWSYVLPLPDGPIGDATKTYTFAFSQALTCTWCTAQLDSVLIEAARHPNVKILAYNTNNDPLKQVADLETAVAQKVDGILVWPHSVAPLTPEIEKIYNEGIPIIGMERTVATSKYSSWIYLDNAKATADVAAAVCKALDGKGTVAETDGAPGSSPQILRRQGFVGALKYMCPDVKVVFTSPTDYSRAQGYKVATDFLQSPEGKDIQAWYDQYSEIGFGINKALKDNNLTDLPHFTIVDGKVATQAVIDGAFTGVAPWSPVHGDLALRAMIYLVTGRASEVPHAFLLTQPPLITKGNAPEVLKSEWPG